jgi:hypothetical protein
MKFIYTLLILFLFGCKKEQLNESSIEGKYTLVTVKECLPFKKDKIINHPFTNAKFVFNNANEVKCYVGNDSLFGIFNFEYRTTLYDGDNSNKQKGINMQLSNFNRTQFINWHLWDVKFRNSKKYLIGHQDRSRGTYRFEFMRNF